MKPVCRHCQKDLVTRPRNLCWTCYNDPLVRILYPPTSKFARRGNGHGPQARQLPPFPTSALPGSPEKIAVLEQRAGLGLELWHPEDARQDNRWSRHRRRTLRLARCG